jgi:aminoglycoside phosphotransferase (APT) family kinase protein
MELVGKEETPHLTALTGGVSSLIVLAKTARGLLCVKQALPRLKVAQEWYAPVARNQAEVAWLRVARQIAPGSVPCVLGEDAQTKSFAMEYLDPAIYPVWKEQLRDGVIEPQTARVVAENLAAMHRTTAGRPDLAEHFANDDTFHALRLESYFVATARTHADVAAALYQLVKTTSETKYALVHGDISPKNILVGPRGPVFLDAECAWYGDPAFDLAFCLNHLLLKCVWHPEHSSRYLDCFGMLTHTYLERVSWEPATMLEARAAMLLAGMLLARIDGKSPVEYITEERDRTAVRRFAKARLLAAPARLQEIGSDWASEWKQERERRG